MKSIEGMKGGKEWLESLDSKFSEHSQEIESITDKYYKRKGFFHMMFMSKIMAWKNYAMISSDRRNDLGGKEKQWMSNVVTPFTYILCKSLYEKIFGFKQEADIDFPFADWEEHGIEKWLNTIVESTELVDQYSEIIWTFIQHGSAWLRPHMVYTDRIEDYKKSMKIASSKKEEVEAFPYSDLIIESSVYTPYNFIYDQRKNNVYKSSFFTYSNYEPLNDFLERWKAHLDEKDVEKIRKYIGSMPGGQYENYCDYNRFRELEAIDLYLIDIMKEESELTLEDLFGGEKFTTAGYFSDIPEGDFFVQEHYTTGYITLRIQGITVAVIDNFMSEQTNGKIYHPYTQFNVTSSPSKTMNKSIPEVLYHLHKIHDMVYNGFSDQLKMTLNPMFVSDGPLSMVKDGVTQDKIEYEPYGIIEYSGTGKLTPLEIGQVNSGILNILDYILGTGQVITSITRYSGGGKSGVERSATGAELMVDITNDAVRPTHSGLQISTNRFFKICMILTKKVIGDQLFIEMDEEKEEALYVDLSPISDINNFDIDIEFRSDTVSDLVTSKEINKITTILNTIQPAILQMQNLDGLPFLKVREIYKNLFDKIQANDFIATDEEVQEALAKMQEQMNNQNVQGGNPEAPMQQPGVAPQPSPLGGPTQQEVGDYIDESELAV